MAVLWFHCFYRYRGLQKISGHSLISDRLVKELKQFYGGFSDFNAFGFFSGVMFLWSSDEIKNKNPLGFATFAISLVGTISPVPVRHSSLYWPGSAILSSVP